jgi:hypothetical protein
VAKIILIETVFIFDETPNWKSAKIYSPELELLDQLLGGDMPLSAIHKIFSDEARFSRALSAQLASGEIRLITINGTDIPDWKRSDVLADPSAWSGLLISLTLIGSRRVS